MVRLHTVVRDLCVAFAGNSVPVIDAAEVATRLMMMATQEVISPENFFVIVALRMNQVCNNARIEIFSLIFLSPIRRPKASTCCVVTESGSSRIEERIQSVTTQQVEAENP